MARLNQQPDIPTLLREADHQLMARIRELPRQVDSIEERCKLSEQRFERVILAFAFVAMLALCMATWGLVR